MTPSDPPPPAPFVGPRPYKIGEKLFGRDRERLELLDILIAERIVLLYSTSGAGKTSLVQAALVPALRNEAFTVPAVARVTFQQATGVSEPPANRYVFAVLLSLEEGQPKERQFPLAVLMRKTLPDYLDERWAETAQTGGMVLIIDQFEEILTIDPTDLEAKREFFAQLGAALRSRYRWALLSMREEHVAGLDPYRSMIPTSGSARLSGYELLNEQQARRRPCGKLLRRPRRRVHRWRSAEADRRPSPRSRPAARRFARGATRSDRRADAASSRLLAAVEQAGARQDGDRGR